MGEEIVSLKVAGAWRPLPASVWYQLHGPRPDPRFGSKDGCTCSPDFWRGKPIWPACVIHDYHYQRGGCRPLGNGSWADRRDADSILRRNIRFLLRRQGLRRLEAGFVAWLYWGRVRIWGRDHFSFGPFERPLGRWELFKEAYGLFRDKREKW